MTRDVDDIENNARYRGRKRIDPMIPENMASNEPKLKSNMPKGGTQTPKGDLGALRQRESMKLGGFKNTTSVSPAQMFKGRAK